MIVQGISAFLKISIGAGVIALSIVSYSFEKPEISILPDELREISGLTVVDSKTLAAVQDEEGILYIINLRGEIEKKISFAGAGDFEGLAFVKNEFYTLRSDGKLFRLSHWESEKKIQVDSFETNIPNIDNEGFCFDRERNALLIGSKSKRSNLKKDKQLRTIYNFDLRKKSIDTTKTIYLNVADVLHFASTHKTDLHQLPSKKDPLILKPNLKIQISAMYVHPTTQELFILSASDHYLFVLDKDRSLTSIFALTPELYNKAEGIAIQENGDLYISNEGQRGKPTLLKIKSS